jgi:hypothetical protein
MWRRVALVITDVSEEDGNFHNYSCENLKIHTIFCLFCLGLYCMPYITQSGVNGLEVDSTGAVASSNKS